MSDTFLESMTFSNAGAFDRDCDCDECGPVPFAIQKWKRQRLLNRPIKRTQKRSLINRYTVNGSLMMSVYSISMPKNAEPLIEFGNSHRIVWIRRLVHHGNTFSSNNRNNILQWIGKGIIGSSDEEKGRNSLYDLTEDCIFFVPSNGGKAIGWIHTTAAINESTFNQEADGGYAVLYVVKIPPDVLNEEKQGKDTNINDNDDKCQWATPLINGCRVGLELMGNSSVNSTPKLYYKYSNDSLKILKKAILEAEKGKY